MLIQSFFSSFLCTDVSYLIISRDITHNHAFLYIDKAFWEKYTFTLYLQNDFKKKEYAFDECYEEDKAFVDNIMANFYKDTVKNYKNKKLIISEIADILERTKKFVLGITKENTEKFSAEFDFSDQCVLVFKITNENFVYKQFFPGFTFPNGERFNYNSTNPKTREGEIDYTSDSVIYAYDSNVSKNEEWEIVHQFLENSENRVKTRIRSFDNNDEYIRDVIIFDPSLYKTFEQ
ncbi:putative SP-containing protein [Vairimorpha necatrix]|uniref:SP-containing protein n=1 Tax=Vairimorpha necatrix TaxID=6039 RepID=A0AAX4JEJ5_9MICR